jgi:hypothetical protein
MSDWDVFPLGVARGLAGSSCSHLAMQSMQCDSQEHGVNGRPFAEVKENAPFVPANGGTERRVYLEDYKLIFVEDNPINQHAVAFTGVMNTHWHPDFYSGANGCFIELFAAPGHVNDLFSKAVLFWTRCLFQHNRAARSELSNGSSSLGRSRGGSCL